MRRHLVSVAGDRESAQLLQEMSDARRICQEERFIGEKTVLLGTTSKLGILDSLLTLHNL